MATGTAGAAPPKPSFAKVAASTYIPKIPNATENSNPDTDASKPAVTLPADSGVAFSESADNAMPLKIAVRKPVIPRFPASNGETKMVVTGGTLASGKPSGEHPLTDDPLTKTPVNDETSTQFSSDGSAKQPSFDTKSVASAMTLGLDEKESLRPDDSASIRASAVEEEDVFSAPGSVVAGSRGGSDNGGRAFRDQLHEVAYMNNYNRYNGGPYKPQPTGAESDGPALLAQDVPSQPGDEAASGRQSAGIPDSLKGVADDKLLHAFRSQRDRVFVLKLEQDLVDFVSQSAETSMTLPQTNSFYRMLAHKLADYYGLHHIVDHQSGGIAILISKTQFTRMPTALSTLTVVASETSTPPIVLATKKIMRRGGNTASSSQGPSATPSENGVDGSTPGTGHDSKKPASALTREEREAKYNEARERIFGKGSGEPSKENSDEDDSRASSTTGKAKTQTVRKQRNLSNDDFEPRSQFPGYYNPNYQGSGYNSDPYYGQYPANVPQQQYPGVPPAQNPPVPGYGNYPAGQPQYSWNGQTMPPTVSGNAMSHYAPTTAPGYDLSSHFSNAMSFQNTPPIPSNVGQQIPYGPQPYQHSQGSHMQMQQWQPQPGYEPQHVQVQQVPQMQQVPPNGYMNSIGSQAQTPYSYNSMPSSSYPQPMAAPTSHYVPYGPQPFNPQSQTFIPQGVRQVPVSQPIPSPAYPGYSQPFRPSGLPHPTSSPMPPANIHRPNHHNHGMYPPTRHPNQPPTPSGPRNYNGPPGNGSAAAPQSPPGSSRSLAEIGAKWGKPDSLPAKPPTPVSMEPSMWNQINKTLLNAGLIEPVTTTQGGAYRTNGGNHSSSDAGSVGNAQPQPSQPSGSAVAAGGNLSTEHGIGQAKTAEDAPSI